MSRRRVIPSRLEVISHDLLNITLMHCSWFLLNVDSSGLPSVTPVHALPKVMGVYLTLGLLPVALCVNTGQHCRRLLWGQ
jgi:hypothetical protein